jgi:hypothetical protein
MIVAAGSDRAKSSRLRKSEVIASNGETFCSGPHARACKSTVAAVCSFAAVVRSFPANFSYAAQLNLWISASQQPFLSDGHEIPIPEELP